MRGYQVKRFVKNSFTRCVNDGSFAGRSAGGAQQRDHAVRVGEGARAASYQVKRFVKNSFTR